MRIMKYLYVIPTLCALVLQVRPQDTGRMSLSPLSGTRA